MIDPHPTCFTFVGQLARAEYHVQARRGSTDRALDHLSVWIEAEEDHRVWLKNLLKERAS